MNQRKLSLLLKTKLFFAILLSLFLVSTQQTLAACGLSKNTDLGSVTISSDCTIDADTKEGADYTDSEDSTNTASVTIDASVTIASGVSATTTLLTGSLSLGSSGSLAIGSSNVALKVGNGIWVTDEDADSWAADFTLYDATQSGKRRLGLMKSDTETDCNDSSFSSDNTCYSYSQGGYWRYGYGQGSYWRYGYGQSGYWRYGYSQGAYWRYGYSQGYYTSCFTGETRVLMADGTYKEIKNIRGGDKVLSYNFEKGTLEEEKVAKLLVHPDTPGGYLVINGELEVTGNHIVWSPNKDSWVRIDSLEVGDTLLNAKGESEEITSIKKVEGTNTVYNLSLPGPNHNFFTEDFLVHNHKVVN